MALRLSSTAVVRLARIIGLLLIVLMTALHAGKLPVLEPLYKRLQLLAYDQSIRSLPSPSMSGPIPVVIVDIDERSLLLEGRWPWSRKRVADLIASLGEAGAAVVVLDILLSEPERNPVDELSLSLSATSPLRSELAQLRESFDPDRQLAELLLQHSVVLGYVFQHTGGFTVGQLPSSLHFTAKPDVEQLAMPEMSGYTAPLPILVDAASGAGFFSLQPDRDGIIRRAPMLARYQGELYPSLSLEAARQYLFLDEMGIHTEPISGLENVSWLGLDSSLRIPTDGLGNMLVPYRDVPGFFPYISAVDVLSGEADPHLLDGAIVLVGTTAPGLFDLRSTPLQSVFPGVEIHANVIAAILGDAFLVEPSWAHGANFLYLLIAGLLLAWFLPRLGAFWQIPFSLLIVGLIISLNAWLWVNNGLVLDSAGPVLLVVLLLFFNLGWGFLFETMTRHRLKDMFGQYVPPALVEEMSEQPGEFGFAGEERELSVLFSDIRGFTTLSESLDAGGLKQLLNRYFTPMTRIIFEHRGTIDKYVGDMVMAFWGAPLDDPKHAVHAIQTALEMLEETEKLKHEFTQMGLPPISVGIGINSGLMNVGDMGSEYRRAYTVLGDAVNLASRLEGTTKYYGVGLVVGERTHELAIDHFVWRELDLVRVKGKEHPVRVFQPVCPAGSEDEALLQELADLDRALVAFRSRQWSEASELFTGLQQRHPEERLYGLYLERLQVLEHEPPAADWDGSWVRTEK